ncbi:putative METHIONYL-TRNA SYNTHETASE, mitochondrial [Lasiosphaeria miniovina]|uniref:Probable methionine--tRNA ligase, mitochondrial n=1 Tax=Lasiosphaeria miniovina TaxID=1954250 RepID=A0AA40B3W6_9PEZI|nr:putative METHIONYL-TRNA SYNTHETASE, mitochondrial [Lasiosphaeria miniovina]KAK0727225.1 putative METHIONYL-TRNA SYNTHETASE, mitochondrial [Lasiosphaeria miniovina]
MVMEALRTAPARRILRWRSATAWSRGWVCRSCSSQSPRSSSRSFTTARATSNSTSTSISTPTSPSPSAKPYYVTTPIYYVNAAPHVGHLYSMVLADVLKRWQTLAGKRALLCTGTDEHGIKVQQAAARNGVHPKNFCDDNAAKFENLANTAVIDYDRFMRTTDQDHVDAVKHFWFLLKGRGLIYRSTHTGWYSVSDECFYPETHIEKTMDPFTGEVFMASIETGNKVEWTEEKNYHFRMTEMKSKLLDFYNKNPEWVVPAARMSQVVDWVKNSLEDLSISRPVDRLSWGIRVPDDESQTIYVWVDALINYITNAGFPLWTPGSEHEGGWPADVHVIGKDIVRFHCVYWPALLLALDLPLPKRVLSHAHWTMDRKKMSKSVGNVVNPFSAIERFGIDALRFYLINDGGIIDDGDYSNEKITERYKHILQSGLGNLLARVTRAERWNIRQAIVAASGGDFGPAPQSLEDVFVAHDKVLRNAAPAAAKQMEELNPRGALRAATAVMIETNKFFTETAPWNLVKQKGMETALARAIYLAAESLRITGILMQPFMPGKATELLDALGVANDMRTLDHATPYTDFDYGTPFVALKRPYSGLFPQLPVED